MNTKNFSIIAIVVLFVSVLLGCETSQHSPETEATAPKTELAAAKEQIKSNLIAMWDAIEKGDMERYASYVHPDFTSFGENAKVLRSGKAAEVKAIREWIEEPTKVHTEMKDPEVTIRGDTAWITYYWSDGGTTKGEKFSTKGKSTRIFVKEDGKWLCIHGHYTLLED